MEVRTITEQELRDQITLTDEAMHAIESAFVQLSQGNVTMPPIMRIDVPEHNGEVDVKSAYMPGWESFTIKLSSGFFDNPKRGLASGSGLMVVIDSATGYPKALLLDNGYLTDVRTALAGGIAAKYLAPQHVDTVGIIGSGNQAQFQLQALQMVRSFNKVLVCSKHIEHAQQYAETMSQVTGRVVEPCKHIQNVVEKSQVVVTTTPTQEPLIQPEWLHSNLHITAMGSDAEHKNEIHPEVFLKADRIACDSLKQCLRLGELHHAQEAGVFEQFHANVVEMGQVIANQAVRQGEDEITICDLTGTGVQDTAIAAMALQQVSTSTAI